MSNFKPLNFVLPLLILLLAGLISIAIVRSRKTPERHTSLEPGVLVRTLEVANQAQQVFIHATGIVRARQEISLITEVSGKLVSIAPGFVEGGFFRQGDKLVEIDPRDYLLARQRAQAELAQAKTNLQIETEKSNLAKLEWERLDLQHKGTPGSLVLRLPQLQSAEANLVAAQAVLDQTDLNLERTIIRAPFNGRLRSKKIDLGQYVRSGNSLGIFAGTDQAEVITPLQIEDLRWLNIPDADSDQQGSKCIISASFGRKKYNWLGTINRAFGEVDDNNRMTKIAIRVEDPYRRETTQQGETPLLDGLFVEVKIEGPKLKQLVSIPRNSLRAESVVWLADANNRLEIRPVHVLRRQQQNLLIDQGLSGGERLILTNISGAAQGMQLRLQNGENRP